MIICELLTKEPHITAFEKVKNNYPIELNSILHKALSHDINQRFSSANDFLDALNSISSTVSFMRTEPSKAFCLNPKCPKADWSGNGYYRYPYLLFNSIDKHCDECGGILTYQCKKCGGNINHKNFCGGCGIEVVKIPKCKKCKSWLTLEDMDKNTKKDGCQKCRRKEEEEKEHLLKMEQQTYPPTVVIPDLDDEIPF